MCCAKAPSPSSRRCRRPSTGSPLPCSDSSTASSNLAGLRVGERSSPRPRQGARGTGTSHRRPRGAGAPARADQRARGRRASCRRSPPASTHRVRPRSTRCDSSTRVPNDGIVAGQAVDRRGRTRGSRRPRVGERCTYPAHHRPSRVRRGYGCSPPMRRGSSRVAGDGPLRLEMFRAHRAGAYEGALVVTDGSRYPPGLVVGTCRRDGRGRGWVRAAHAGWILHPTRLSEIDYVKVIVGFSPIDVGLESGRTGPHRNLHGVGGGTGRSADASITHRRSSLIAVVIAIVLQTTVFGAGQDRAPRRRLRRS